MEQLYKNNVKAVELFGGDVFLRKDILMPLIRFLKERKMIIHLPTNANLLTEDIAKQLVKNEVDYVYISVDGIENVQDKLLPIKPDSMKIILSMWEKWMKNIFSSRS